MPTLNSIQDIWRKTSRSRKESDAQKNEAAPLITASTVRQPTSEMRGQKFTAKKPFEQTPYSMVSGNALRF